MYSRQEDKEANNKYNCPIVISYSEVLKNNVEELNTQGIKFINPFLPFDKQGLVKRLYELEDFKEYGFTKKRTKRSSSKGRRRISKI